MMKKMIAVIISVLFVLLAAEAALAEQGVRMFYDAAVQLLFETGNVTLSGKAEFSLDGERFKTAEAGYVQDGSNSLLRLHLLTPRRDGSDWPDRESGYTVVANGEKVYVMEVFYPGVYKTGTTSAQSAILRESVQMGLMKNLLGVLADQAENWLGDQAVTIVTEDQGAAELRIELGEDAPEIVNTALNVFCQFFEERYFGMDYDQIEEQYMVPMESYITVTEGILRSVKSFSLKHAGITARTDSAGRLEQVKGDVSVMLDTGRDGVRQLDISFLMDVSGWGESHVAKFDPQEYGVVLMDGAMNVDGFEETETEYYDEDEAGRLLEGAQALLRRSGYAADLFDESMLYAENGQIHYGFLTSDGTGYVHFYTDQAGKLLNLYNYTNGWGDKVGERVYTLYPNENLVKDAEAKLMEYLADVNPELREKVSGFTMAWWTQAGKDLWFCFIEDASNPEAGGAVFVVRAAPEWQIDFFSSVSNG